MTLVPSDIFVTNPTDILEGKLLAVPIRPRKSIQVNMDKADESSDVMPVTSLDDEQQTAQTTQREEYGSPNNLISGLIQVPHTNDGYSPAPQLESSLNESVNDSYAQSEGLMKVPQLESTRISTTCAPEDFDPGADLSKVQSESGDSQNPLNAGFVKPDNPEQSKLTSTENSVFIESDSETGIATHFLFYLHLTSYIF